MALAKIDQYLSACSRSPRRTTIRTLPGTNSMMLPIGKAFGTPNRVY